MAAPGDLRLTDLPNEILLNIFSYLSYSERIDVRQTCRRFSQLTRDPSLWKAITIDADFLGYDEEARQQYDEHMSMMLKQRRYKELCTEKESGAEDEPGLLVEDTVEVKNSVTAVQEVGRVLPSCSVTGQMFYTNLTSIKFHNPCVPITDFLVRYSNLRHITAVFKCSTTEHKDISLTAETFRVLKGLKELRTLIIVQSRDYSYRDDVNESVRNYFLSGPKLTHIDLCFKVDGKIAKAIVNHCSELQYLLLGNSDLTSEAFTAATPRLMLSTLLLSLCTRLDDKCLKAIALAFPNLQNLEVVLTPDTSEEGMTFLFRACSRLTSLELTIGILHERDTNKDLFRGRYLHELARTETRGQLHKLHLVNLVFLDKHVFTDLFKNQQNLTDVKLVHCGVSDKDIVFLSENCRQLRKVHVWYCPEGGTTAMTALLKNLPELDYITWLLKSGTLFRFDDLLPLLTTTRPTRQHRLEHLKLGPCTNVTGRGLSALLSLCPNLLVLKITADYSLDDDCIMSILRGCALLKDLKIQRRGKNNGGEQETLSDASLRYIQRMGLRLQHVCLPYSPLFSDRVLAQTVLQFDKLLFLVWTTRERRSEISDLQQSFELEMRRLRGRKKSVRCWWTSTNLSLTFSVTRFRWCASDHRLRFLLRDT